MWISRPALGVLGGPADVIVTEIFGDQPFSESVVPSLAHAREVLSHPLTTLVPGHVRVVAALAYIPGFENIVSLQQGQVREKVDR